MNGAQRRNGSNLETQFPGCTGRRVSLFDLNSGVHSNKLIADGAHDDDSLCLRSRSDVGTTSRPSVHRRGTEDNLSPRNRKVSRVAGKILCQEDMSKKEALKDNPPNLVAKLMGLEALPLHQSGSAAPKLHAREFSPRKDSATVRRRVEEEDGSSKKIMQRQMTQILSSSVGGEYKDTHENWQKLTDRNQSSPIDSYNGTVDVKQMSFVRQKFIEAKCLATDNKLRQSKEFDDALEFLSSNRDLFVRFLQEPNSLFSKNLSEFYPLPPSPGTKRITLLRPSKIDKKSSKKPTRGEQTYFAAMRNQRDDELTFQPTQIVVLKPNNGKIHGIKRVASPPCSSPGAIHGEQSSNEPQNDKTEEFRILAGEITHKIRANLTGNRANKICTAAVFSNDCSADNTLFTKSENEYAVERSSDSEFMSPSSSHAWSYAKNCSGPFLHSSFSRILSSPESSLSKEAKKRLSERWAMIATHGGNAQEQRGVRRNSNTLGDMLALPETKKSAGYGDEGRKQSILETSTMCNRRIKIEEGSEEVMQKKDKSSLRGKVSSLFSSRNKKLSKDADNTLLEDDILQSFAHPESRTFSSSTSNETRLQTCLCSSFSTGTSSDSVKMRHQRGDISREKGSARQQPGPIAVLDPPFEFQKSVKSIIDKSPPIESIARSQLRDGSSCSCTSRGAVSSVSTRKEEESNFLLYVQTLLTMARLESNSFNLQWHSHENPLDPSLRYRYTDLDSKERDNEAKRRKLRSNQMLAFDSIITALLEVRDYGSDWNGKTISNCRALSMDGVMVKMKEWFNGEARFAGDEGEDSGSLVVEGVVREKVVGREWVEHLKMEAQILGREVEERLMEEMVEEAVLDFANDI